MSLIYFHRFLIVTAILFALFFGWKVFTYWQNTGELNQLVVASLCGLGAIGLAFYLRTVRVPQQQPSGSE